MPTVNELLQTLPQIGTLDWIGIRPARNIEMEVREQAYLEPGKGITEDRFKGKLNSKRQVTIIQKEHLAVIAGLLHVNLISATLLRRNLVFSGINVLALKDQYFCVGDVILKGTGLCHPCSKMEKVFGSGGYNAIRGHGGITAKVITSGHIYLFDEVKFIGSSIPD